MEENNAVITGVSISSEDHGCLSAWVALDYGGSGQGFGGYVLYLPSTSKHHNLLSCAGHFIYRVMEVAGVTKWNNVTGKTVRVRHDHSTVYEIGHIVDDDWFNPREDFANVKSGGEGE